MILLEMLDALQQWQHSIFQSTRWDQPVRYLPDGAQMYIKSRCNSLQSYYMPTNMSIPRKTSGSYIVYPYMIINSLQFAFLKHDFDKQLFNMIPKVSYFVAF